MRLNLELSMLSGQTPHFVWERKGNNFARALDGKIIELGQQNGKLETSHKRHARELLRLDDDLEKILKKISTDPFMEKAVQDYSGLRVTKSGLWETTACFVLSSNRSIPLIRKNVQLLMQNYGARVDELHEFPFPEDIAKCSLDGLRKSKCGFRDKYLQGTAAKVLERGDLDFRDSAELKEFLLSCPGIGEKIANCILLYGFGDLSAFPIDVWMKRAMQETYFCGKEQKKEALLGKADSLWGNLKGYAQIYLFYEFMSKKPKKL